MRYSPRSPFTVRETRHLSQTQIERLSIFADFWDRIGNSGHFPQLKRKFDDPFGFFYPLTQWLYARFGRTHSIHLRELEEALTDYLKDFSSARVESLKPELPARQARHWAAAAAANQSVPSLWTSNIH